MLGHVPRFISAVGFDEQADKVLRRMSLCQLPTDFVQRNQFSTGAVNVSFVDGEPEYEIPLGQAFDHIEFDPATICLLYTSPSPRDRQKSRMPSSA